MNRWLIAAASAAVLGIGASSASTGAAAGSASPEADPPGGESFVFGVISQEKLDGNELGRMSRARLRSLRLGLFWPRVEPQYSSFDWREYDAQFARAARHGVTILPYLYGIPAWAAHYDGISCSSDCTAYAPASAATRGAFAFFASEAVRRYGPGGRFWAAHPEVPYRPVRSWQIWNEQNSPKYFAPAPDVGSYAALLARTAVAMRSVDPAAEIVLGGMWGPNSADEVIPTATYLRRLLAEPNARASFDSVAVHPYAAGPDGMLSQLEAVRRALRQAGAPAVPIWITELGWASAGPAGHPLVKGRRGQAQVLEQAYEALLERHQRWQLRGAYWYAWEDTPPDAGYICSWCPGSGLRSVSGGPKPAWHSLKRLTRAE